MWPRLGPRSRAPSRKPSQALVHAKLLDQHVGLRQTEHGLGGKRTRQRPAVFEWATGQAALNADEGLDPRHLDHGDNLLVLLALWSQHLPQAEEKIALNSLAVA